MIAKPGNKTATVSWPDPYGLSELNAYSMLNLVNQLITEMIEFEIIE